MDGSLVKFLLDNWILVLMALSSGAMLLWPMLNGGAAAGSVSTAEAVRLINREKGILIDVCEPAEFASGHASGAKSIPLGSIPSTRNLPSNKELPLVVICASGMRSSRAVAMLKKQGYVNAHSLAGGMKAWRDASLPVERSA